jgi:hypothetical protein
VDRDMCIFNGSTTSSPILFGIYATTNVQEAARISAARNFIVGTSVDSGNRFQVSGTGYLFNLKDGGTSRIAGTIGNTSGGLDFGLEGSSGNQLFTGMAAYEGGIGTSVARNFNVATNGIVRTYWNGTTGAATFISDVNILKSQPNLNLNSNSTSQFTRLVFQENSTDKGVVQYINSAFGGFRANKLELTNANGISFVTTGIFTSPDMYLPNSGNVLIGTTTDNGTRLQVNGNISVAPGATPAGKVPTGTFMPIIVNGTTYYLALNL